VSFFYDFIVAQSFGNFKWGRTPSVSLRSTAPSKRELLWALYDSLVFYSQE
jgi:hypothetical protein